MQHGGRILVVDDDHACRLLISSIVAQAGFQVDAVADGEMAMAMMQSRAPTMVLLDADLPRVDGFEVCRRIKGNPATRHVPVVMVTAFASSSARQRGLEAGADEFLEKPFRADTLLDLVGQLLDIREARAHLDMDESSLATALKRS